MDERKFDMNRDGLGLLLFALGLFPAVLIVKALLATEPLESISGDGPIARTWIETLGAIPSLVFTGGIVGLGGRLFLFGRRDGLVRHALGLAGVALALSVFLGAFSPTAGGNIGFATGGLVSGGTHVTVGALFGLVALSLAIWFPWFRSARADRADRANRIGADPVIGISAALDREADMGVSAEEAAALIPEDFNRVLDEGRKQLAVKPIRSAPPPSPYPEDVRLKGQIPVGARPLTSPTDATTQSESAAQTSSVYRWTAPRTDVSGDGADEDLAPVRDPEVVFAAEPLGGDDAWSDEPARSPVEDATDAGLEELEPGTELSARADEVAGDPGAIGASAEALSALPRPSWEQSNLFTEPEEPAVDAYGTPRKLVELLRQARGASASSEIDADEVIEVLPTETDFAAELEAGGEDGPELVDAGVGMLRAVSGDSVDEDVLDEDVDFEDGSVLEGDLAESDDELDTFEYDDELEPDGDEDEEDADEDEEESDDELQLSAEPSDRDAEQRRGLELAPSSTGAGAGASAADSTTDDGRSADSDDVATAAELREATVDARPALEVGRSAASPRGMAPASPSADDGPLVELMERPEPARDQASTRSDAAELAPKQSQSPRRAPATKPREVESERRDLEPTRSESDPKRSESGSERSDEPTADRGARALDHGEREVVLEPRPVSREKAIKSQPVLPERSELLREAGCLFVERGRVAVSMLQRQYGMDFDEACEVLDELQNLGLIGPYLGGQRRDILLTREQWLEKVGSG